LHRSFLVGLLPLSFALSPSQLRLISSIGMGVLVGTSLIVIIPEGIETLYGSALLRTPEDLHTRSLDIKWQRQDANLFFPPKNAALPGRNIIHDLAVPGGSSELPESTTPVRIEEGYIPGAENANNQGLLGRDESQNNGHEQKNDQVNQDHESSLHVWIGIALISGFTLMYLIDKLPSFASSSKQQRLPHHISLDNLGFGLQRSSSPSHDGGLLERSSSWAHSHSFATTTGLVIHATADGIALGASGSDTNLSFIIFLALLIHKAPASFGLTSVLLKQGLSNRATRAHLLVFSLAAPIGALATFFFTQTVGLGFSRDEAATRWWTGMILLFSAGTFL
jgi:solute carrier family 39 (zinc transporter), member 9